MRLGRYQGPHLFVKQYGMHAPLRPLVSIIIRSMTRDSLSAALASVSASSYRPLEIVLVNAKGGEHAHPPAMGEEIAVRLHNLSGPPLDRAAAANCGLTGCSGEFALLLDDDDLLDTGHIQTLATTLTEHPQAVAAYTGVRLVDAQGALIRELNEPWEPDRLLGMNFLPIHAVMFRVSHLRGKAAFDPTLELMEDWDFWRQLAQLGNFVRIPGCSATYNLGRGESGLSGQRNIPAMIAAHAAVLERVRRNDALAPSRALFWFDTALTHVQGEKRQLLTELESAHSRIASLEEHIRSMEVAASECRDVREGLRAELDELHATHMGLRQVQSETNDQLVAAHAKLAVTQATLRSTEESLALTEESLTLATTSYSMILSSTSWRITAPLRALVTKIRTLMK